MPMNRRHSRKTQSVHPLSSTLNPIKNGGKKLPTSTSHEVTTRAPVNAPSSPSATPRLTGAAKPKIITVNMPMATPPTASASTMNSTANSPSNISTAAAGSSSAVSLSTSESITATSSPVLQTSSSASEHSSLGPSASITNVAVLSAPGVTLHSAAIAGIAASLTVSVLILLILLEYRRRRSRRLGSRMTMGATPFYVPARTATPRNETITGTPQPDGGSHHVRPNTPLQKAEIVVVPEQPSVASRNSTDKTPTTQNAAASSENRHDASAGDLLRGGETNAADANLAAHVIHLTARVHELEAERRISGHFQNADWEESPPEYIEATRRGLGSV